MNLNLITFKLKSLLLILLLPIALLSSGQNSNVLNTTVPGKTNNIDNQIKYIHKLYSENVEVPKEFINGKEYESYYTRSTNKPLLLPDKKRSASIFTRTRRYNNLTLQYDTFLDEVIYTDTSRILNFRFPEISLNKDIVEGFNLYLDDDSLIFKYLRSPYCTTKNLKEGYYEFAYQGRSSFLIKHTSSYYVREGLNEYKYAPEKYISIGDVYYKVKSKGSLLRIFGDKSPEINKYLRASRIRIKDADKKQFVGILKYYDSLLSSK